MDKDLHFTFKNVPIAYKSLLAAMDVRADIAHLETSFRKEIAFLKKLTVAPSEEVIRHLMRTISEEEVEI